MFLPRQRGVVAPLFALIQPAQSVQLVLTSNNRVNNYDRPHDRLGRLTSATFRPQVQNLSEFPSSVDRVWGARRTLREVAALAVQNVVELSRCGRPGVRRRQTERQYKHCEHGPHNVRSAVGPPESIIQNAAASTSTGVEFDGRWAASENLTISFSGAILDSVYDSYPGAVCATVTSEPGGRMAVR